MEVTVPLIPGMVEGIVTAPPGPMYRFIVMAVPFTVKGKFPCSGTAEYPLQVGVVKPVAFAG